MHDVVAVAPLDEYRLRLTFEDGREGVIDLSSVIKQGGVFAPLADPAFFRQVSVNPEIGAICRPNGADLCPDSLYAMATGRELPEWAERTVR